MRYRPVPRTKKHNLIYKELIQYKVKFSAKIVDRTGLKPVSFSTTQARRRRSKQVSHDLTHCVVALIVVVEKSFLQLILNIIHINNLFYSYSSFPIGFITLYSTYYNVKVDKDFTGDKRILRRHVMTQPICNSKTSSRAFYNCDAVTSTTLVYGSSHKIMFNEVKDNSNFIKVLVHVQLLHAQIIRSNKTLQIDVKLKCS